MKPSYTAIIRRDGKWWIGWIEDVTGVNAQAPTRKELLRDLAAALSDFLVEHGTVTSSLAAGLGAEHEIITADGESIVFTPTLTAIREAKFDEALRDLNARFGGAMKRLAE